MAQAIVDITEIYLWIGIVIAFGFVIVGIDRVDADARGAFLFRLMILPGVIGLWPLVVWRWAALERQARG